MWTVWIPKREKIRIQLESFVKSINRNQKPIVVIAANMLKFNRLHNKQKADQTTTPKELAENISKSLPSVIAGEVFFKKFKEYGNLLG